MLRCSTCQNITVTELVVRVCWRAEAQGQEHQARASRWTYGFRGCAACVAGTSASVATQCEQKEYPCQTAVVMMDTPTSARRSSLRPPTPQDIYSSAKRDLALGESASAGRLSARSDRSDNSPSTRERRSSLSKLAPIRRMSSGGSDLSRVDKHPTGGRSRLRVCPAPLSVSVCAATCCHHSYVHSLQDDERSRGRHLGNSRNHGTQPATAHPQHPAQTTQAVVVAVPVAASGVGQALLATLRLLRGQCRPRHTMPSPWATSTTAVPGPHLNALGLPTRSPTPMLTAADPNNGAHPPTLGPPGRGTRLWSRRAP